MGEADADIDYLSIGANRQTAVADWHRDGTLAFGADWNICLWKPMDPRTRGISGILGGHTGAVKVVKFLSLSSAGDGDGGLSYLLTGADDRCLKLWALDLASTRGSCVQTVQEHTGAINCIAVLPPSRNPDRSSLPPRRIVASGAADATIRIWEVKPGAIKLLQTIRTSPKYFPLTVSLHSLTSADGVEAFVLAAAGTRGAIQLFTATQGEVAGLEFQLKATLPGHEGWIRGLDFIPETADTGSDLLLASASQDKYIRLWRLRRHKREQVAGTASAAGGEEQPTSLLPETSPANKAHRFDVGPDDVSATFEALLLGHEDWIYSARWHRAAGGKLRLLSASADNSLSIWEADPASGIWVTVVRLGEVSREKGATTATGSIGGFWTGLWSPDGSLVVTLGRTGSWRLWRYAIERDHWVQDISISGHTRAVTGLAWGRGGEYLLSTSADQTTRLHGEWKEGRGEDEKGDEKDGGGGGGGGKDGKKQRSWHELSRPQIHGYDLNCIDVLDNASFVSGADEKLLRVFSKPRVVAQLIDRLAGIATTGSGAGLESLPGAADVPVLGLSNKAVDSGHDENSPADAGSGGDGGNGGSLDLAGTAEDTQSAPDMDHHCHCHPPFEETLSRHTLWPETEKLYGHGYEISCLAASHDGRLVASACKASSVTHAVIRIFETRHWTELRPPLSAHSLTATRLRFSPDDRFLLSVGRDRQWAVFERLGPDGDGSKGEADGSVDEGLAASQPRYELAQADPKGHSRMILDAAWAPVRGDGLRIFATAGRDKQVKIWAGGSGGGRTEFRLACVVADQQPVTAIDFLSQPSAEGDPVLAVGTEAGKLRVLSLRVAGHEAAVSSSLDVSPDLSLPKAVLQLAWRPKGETGRDKPDLPALAVAGDDSSLRIYRFKNLC